ncbi:M949_RS01915 family surface polysaccharide biosynthesis protein [Undibacterium sp. Di27W]|uniref:M949_RS01915 family surface polysaccharide biosynthesis protein n=1 Tax=Undibacterium sp. Di27W TaxID=3413036 RepID=UPI003BF28DF0
MKNLLSLIFLLPVLAFAEAKNSAATCTDKTWLNADTLKKSKVLLPVFKHYCYSDQSGSYVLYLTEKQDRTYGAEKLSSAVEAHLFKIASDKSLSNVISIRDRAESEEAGMEFWSKLTEIADIDRDGNIDPILVYRFYNQDGANTDREAFSGRLKIIMFYKGEKVVIRAITGNLDGERQTTATENFFSLPASVQKHLVKKMEGMYKDNLYGFDNSYQFVPRKSKGN